MKRLLLWIGVLTLAVPRPFAAGAWPKLLLMYVDNVGYGDLGSFGTADVNPSPPANPVPYQPPPQNRILAVTEKTTRMLYEHFTNAVS